ncbi:MAG TPA: hypothetical protein VH280_07375 [Verrucomicrobiae bacterium]|jgi:hypothetical protein|nr:hypothetical protein [Verrucomicrobiae bacterium]
MSTTAIQLPSGLWAGHYLQFFMKHAQQMNLEFADGLIRGDGSDGLGSFTIDGEYRVDSGEVRMGWIKTYAGAHSVLYLGTLQDGQVVGKWDLLAPLAGTGSFALSPSKTSNPNQPKGQTL